MLLSPYDNNGKTGDPVPYGHVRDAPQDHEQIQEIELGFQEELLHEDFFW